MILVSDERGLNLKSVLQAGSPGNWVSRPVPWYNGAAACKLYTMGTPALSLPSRWYDHQILGKDKNHKLLRILRGSMSAFSVDISFARRASQILQIGRVRQLYLYLLVKQLKTHFYGGKPTRTSTSWDLGTLHHMTIYAVIVLSIFIWKGSVQVCVIGYIIPWKEPFLNAQI